MSALGLDEVSDPRGVLAYAPRKARNADDESTIRPVLERLSRSEGRVPAPRLVPKAEMPDLPPPQVEAVARSAFPMTARLAVAAGVLALVGAAAAGYLAPPSAADHSAQTPTTGAAPSSMPKSVQTVSIQRPAEAQKAARIVKDDARVAQPAAAPLPQASAAAEAALPAPLQPASNDPSVTPLKAWAALPAEAANWTTPAAPPAATEAQAAAEASTPSEPAAKPDVKAPVHKTAPAHQTRHAARHRVTHQRRHRTARAAAADQSAQAEGQAGETQPVKKLPLQAAVDRVFGGGGATAAQQPQR